MPDIVPTYRNQRVSNYRFLDDVAPTIDPRYLFMPDLLRQIGLTPGQELGCHSHSHFYVREPGANLAAFESDLQAFSEIFGRYACQPQSYIFPRNQTSPECMVALARHGYLAARGNPRRWYYESDAQPARLVRLMDAGLSAALPARLARQDSLERIGGVVDVRASRFLRPLSGRGWWDDACTATVMTEMTCAAQSQRCYHLWWHPENFGANVEASLQRLQKLLLRFCDLRDRYGMQSISMAQAAIAEGDTA
jgi:hypothetical protein